MCTVSWQVAEGGAVSWRVPLCARSLGNCGSVFTTILEGMALLAESGGVVGTRMSCLWAAVGLPRCEVPLERLLCLRHSPASPRLSLTMVLMPIMPTQLVPPALGQQLPFRLPPRKHFIATMKASWWEASGLHFQRAPSRPGDLMASPVGRTTQPCADSSRGMAVSS